MTASDPSIDDRAARLLVDRRQRVLDAMADADLDALILGRQDNANFASGMHRLWTAGTRPFGAGCIVIRSTGRTHVLSSWDAGLPATMSTEDLYPATWNPRVMAAHMTEIEGLANAQRIGVDEVSPSFARAASRFAPAATVVPADDVMTTARRVKSDAEVDHIRRACAIAGAGVDAFLADPSGGPAVILEALAAQGATIPSSAPIARRLPDGHSVDVGVIVDGYEGGVGGRFAEGRRLGTADLAAACVPGADHRDLATAATNDEWLVRGLGMGYERPVFAPSLGRDETLEAGMVLSVRDGERRDVIVLREREPEILSIHHELDEARGAES